MISVLIVEDDPLIAEGHRMYLGRLQGFSVAAVANTARDAMRAASEAATTDTPIDLVLLDLGLPDARGIALASGLSSLRWPSCASATSRRPRREQHPAPPTRSPGRCGIVPTA